jgi:hypothetical protein
MEKLYSSSVLQEGCKQGTKARSGFHAEGSVADGCADSDQAQSDSNDRQNWQAEGTEGTGDSDGFSH